MVPVASDRSGGAAIKRSIRNLSLWYVGFVTQQINEFTSSVSRCLHVLEGRLGAVETELAAMRPAPPAVVDLTWAQHEGAWWVAPVTDALRAAPGRVLHAACGNGWLVRALAESGVEAYGVDPGRARSRLGPMAPILWICASRTPTTTCGRSRESVSAASCCLA